MPKSELEEIILESIKKAKQDVESKNPLKRNIDYINEIKNYYNCNTNKEIFLRDFKSYILADLQEELPSDYVRMTKELIKRYKTGRIVMGGIAFIGFVSAPINKFMIFPAIMFAYNAIRMHMLYKKYTQEMNEADKANEFKKKIECIFENTSFKDMKNIFDKNKEEILEMIK